MNVNICNMDIHGREFQGNPLVLSDKLMDNKDRYSLRWNNYSNNITQVFDEHLRKEALVDVTLSCEGEFIKAHKLILSACSDYFRDLFNEHPIIQHPVIIFHTVKAENLKNLLRFMYHGEIKVLENEIEELLTLGESLHVKGLCSVKFKRPAEPSGPSQSPDPNLPKGTNTSDNDNPPPLLTFDQKDTVAGDAVNPGHIKVQSVMVPPVAPYYEPVISSNGAEKRMSVGVDNPVLLMSHKSPMNPGISAIIPGKYRTITKPNILSKHGSNNANKDKIKTYSKLDKVPVKTNFVTTEHKIVMKSSKENHVRKSISPQPSVNRSSPGAFTQTIKVRDFSTEIESSESKRRKLSKIDSPKPVIFPAKQGIQNSTPSPVSESDLRERNIPPLMEKPPEPLKVIETVPRPPNAFMIFANEWRKKLLVEHPNENSKEINYKLGNMWKAMSIETKNVYYNAAKIALDEYKKKVAETDARNQATDSQEQKSVVHAVQLLKLVMKNPDVPIESSQDDSIIYIKEDPDGDISIGSDSSNLKGETNMGN